MKEKNDINSIELHNKCTHARNEFGSIEMCLLFSNSDDIISKTLHILSRSIKFWVILSFFLSNYENVKIQNILKFEYLFFSVKLGTDEANRNQRRKR